VQVSCRIIPEHLAQSPLRSYGSCVVVVVVVMVVRCGSQKKYPTVVVLCASSFRVVVRKSALRKTRPTNPPPPYHCHTHPNHPTTYIPSTQQLLPCCYCYCTVFTHPTQTHFTQDVSIEPSSALLCSSRHKGKGGREKKKGCSSGSYPPPLLPLLPRSVNRNSIDCGSGLEMLGLAAAATRYCCPQYRPRGSLFLSREST